jgi:putative hydrolase of the HAD superfamily
MAVDFKRQPAPQVGSCFKSGGHRATTAPGAVAALLVGGEQAGLGQTVAVGIEAIFFDFGGVFTPSPFSVIRAAGPELGLDPELALSLCFGPYDDDTDHPWHRLERGELALIEARRLLIALAAEQDVVLDPFVLLARLAGEDPDRALFVDRVRQLRAAGYRTGMITNNVSEFGDGWRRMVPVDELFEVIIDSSQVGVRKPDPRIYRLGLEALEVSEPDRAVFLDDHPGNLVGAAKVGMRTVLVGADRSAALNLLDQVLAD